MSFHLPSDDIEQRIMRSIHRATALNIEREVSGSIHPIRRINSFRETKKFIPRDKYFQLTRRIYPAHGIKKDVLAIASPIRLLHMNIPPWALDKYNVSPEIITAGPSFYYCSLQHWILHIFLPKRKESSRKDNISHPIEGNLSLCFPFQICHRWNYLFVQQPDWSECSFVFADIFF